MASPPEERLEALEAVVRQLYARVGNLERALGEAGRPLPAPPPPPSARPPPAQPPPGAAPAPPAPAPPARPLDLEEFLGGRVLAWIGGSAILLGVVFFLVMAVSRGWIDEPTRVALAFLGSAALVALGLWAHERQGRTQAALAAVGSGIAALYASLAAATVLYDLVPPASGLAVAGLVGVAATAIAVRWDSAVVAGIGIVGALLAPVLVGAGTSRVALLFTALALAAGVGVLLWRRWDWLAAAAFLVTVPQLGSWAFEEGTTGLALAAVGAFWLLYVAAAIGYELRVPTAGLRVSSALLLLADAAAVAGLGYALLEDRGYEHGATAWVLVLAAAHVALGVALQGRVESADFGGLALGIGIALSAIGFALALDGPALVAGWAAHAVVLAWLAGRRGDLRAGLGALAFLALAYLHVLADEAPPDSLRVGVDDLGASLAALAAVAAAAFALARLGTAGLVRGDVLPALGAGTVVYLASVLVVDTLAVGPGGQPEQDGQVVLSAFWSLAGLGALVYGLVADDRRLRSGGLALLLVAVGKVFLYDLSTLESIYRVLSFVALGLLLLAGAFAYQRVRPSGGSGREPGSP